MKLGIKIHKLSEMSFTDLKIEEYTDRSVVVQGDTRKYKEDLKKLGGKYNGRLKNGPGWIFSKSSEDDLRTFIKEGKRLVTAEEAKAGEEQSKQRAKQRAKEWESQKDIREKKNSHGSYGRHPLVDSAEPLFGSHVTPTLIEYGAMMNLVKKMSTKIELLEHAVLMLLDDEQKEELKVLMKQKEKKKKSVAKKVDSDSEDSTTESESEEDEPVPRKRLMYK